MTDRSNFLTSLKPRSNLLLSNHLSLNIAAVLPRLRSLPTATRLSAAVLLCTGILPGAGTPESLPLQAPGPPGQNLFTALTPEQSGIDFVNPIDTRHPLKRIYLGAFACGGIGVGDLDGDGRPDLFLTGGSPENALYLQTDKPLRFADATRASGITPSGTWSAGPTLVDIDSDGDLDIHVCNYDAPNHLWINDGKGKFTEQAESFGLAISDASLMATFCDYDLDGDLDCFLLTRDFKRAGGRPKEHPVELVDNKWRIKPGFEKYYDIVTRPGGKQVYINAGRQDVLLRNEGSDAKGQIRFTDVSRVAGISGRDRGNSVTWWDFDNDGLPDIYVGNDFKDADRLYRNNGNGTFTDVIRKAAPHTPWFSMGADVADLDGDGRTDLLIADMAGTNHYRSKTTMGEITSIRPFLLSAVPRQYMHNVLYLNNGVGKLADGAYQAGLANSDWTWAVKLQDFDLNGHVDAFFTNGVSRGFNNSDDQRSASDYIGKTEWDHYESHPPRREANLAFANRGNLKFENISSEWGLDHLGMSYAAATGDLDGDGDAEIIVASLDEPVRIYRNNAPSSARRVTVRLKGAAGNRHGLGADVWVQGGGRLQKGGLQPATGFLSCNQPVLQFGLGTNEKIRHITVKWQRGHVQRFENLIAGRSYLIEEPTTPPPKWARPARRSTPYAPINSPSLRKIAHRETLYDDFTRQPLLPYKHSQLGPGIAWQDVDGDGDADFFLSGGAGHPGRLSLNVDRGTFREVPSPDLAKHAASEDLGALFFDANGDGRQDLYVVSGGVECNPGAELLRDRLYLNNESGRLAHAMEALPDLRDSGSCVVGADYDRDGDIDLFVGGRVVPGAYPEPPSSRLLRNDSTPPGVKFTDQTSLSPGLQHAGLVSGALWSDANGDGWIDLLICCEWGPVKVFLNQEGRLIEATGKSGLGNHLGWWNGIASADLDGDGDLDYVATNQGTNTPYQASREKPELLFYGDFDGSGNKRIVEAKFEGKTCYPRRGFSCSSGAMPILRKRLKTFGNFARSTLGDLYGDGLSDSLRLEVNTLESCVLLNNGQAQFTVRPLPRAAQYSPSQGVLLSDLDADGHVDCVLAQNFFGAQPEIGLLDAGLSLLLHGRGTGDFVASGPDRSGIGVPGAATAITSADLNADGRPELIFAVNNSPLMIFSEPSAREQTNRLLEVRLVGKPGNIQAVGARITVTQAGRRRGQTSEIAAGSGYLGQSEPVCWFGLGPVTAGARVEITVRWPDGASSTTEAIAGARQVVIPQP